MRRPKLLLAKRLAYEVLRVRKGAESSREEPGVSPEELGISPKGQDANPYLTAAIRRRYNTGGSGKDKG